MRDEDRYIERDDLKDASHLKISVYYSKGGMNFFSSANIARGYYLSVTPVNRSGGMESSALFSGYSKLLLQTKRYSRKQFEQALKLSKSFEDELIAAVVSKNQAA